MVAGAVMGVEVVCGEGSHMVPGVVAGGDLGQDGGRMRLLGRGEVSARRSAGGQGEVEEGQER